MRRSERGYCEQGSFLHVLHAAHDHLGTKLLPGRQLRHYQLIINTPTTIITFLLVALLQNTQRRSEQALQHKLNAIADGLSDLMEHFASDGEGRAAKEDLARDVEDLKAAVGLEEKM
jgi:hypothetical protein